MPIDDSLQQIEQAVAAIRAELSTPDLRPETADALQVALDTAPGGTTIKLNAERTYVGNFTLKPRPLERPILVTSDRPISEGRIDPKQPLAVLQSGNTGSALTAQPRSYHWMFVGLRFEGNEGGYGDIARIGFGTETDPADLPHSITLDRILMRGGPLGQKRGVALNGNNLAVIHSDIREIWKSDQDNQTIGAWNTSGQHLIRNNHLESGGEVYLLGGSRSPAGLTAEGVVIEDNEITRPLSWKDPSQLYQIKNLLELKQGRGVMIRRNHFSNNWPAAQDGYALVLTPRNNNELRNVTLEDNVVEHVSDGLSIAGSAYEGANAYCPPFIGLTVRRNLFVISKAEMGGTGRFCQLGGIETDEDSQYLFEFNTIIHDGKNLFTFYRGSYDDPQGVSRPGKPLRGFIFRNNFSRAGGNGFWSETSLGGLAGAFPGAIIEGNVLSGSGQKGQKGALPGNLFPTEVEFQGAFVNYVAGDYTLREDQFLGVGRR